MATNLGAILALLVALTSGCTPTPKTPSTRPTNEASQGGKLSRAQMQHDAQHWYDVVREVHPAPFLNVSKDEMLREMRMALEDLPPEADPLVFMLTMSSLASRMRDSHTHFGYPERSAALQALLFRYPLRIHQGELLWATSDASVSIPPNARISSINGVDSRQLVAWLRAVGIGELDAAIDRDGVTSAPAVFWVRGLRAPFTIEWSREATPSRTTRASGEKPTPVAGNTERPTLELRRTEEGFGVLTLTRMPDPETFLPILEATFGEIAQDEPEALIIDVRENVGGNTLAADLLFAMTTDRPYRIVGGKLWKVSERYKRVIREQYDEPVPEYESAKNGVVLEFTSPEQLPEDYGYRYRGPVCYLIGPFTSSAAMMMANAVQDYDLAVLIGEPTGSPPNYFGEAYGFQLPESGIPAQTSVAYFVRANGDANDTNPVKPDIFVPTTIEDEIAGRDPVLDAALNWARNELTSSRQ